MYWLLVHLLEKNPFLPWLFCHHILSPTLHWKCFVQVTRELHVFIFNDRFQVLIFEISVTLVRYLVETLSSSLSFLVFPLSRCPLVSTTNFFFIFPGYTFADSSDDQVGTPFFTHSLYVIVAMYSLILRPCDYVTWLGKSDLRYLFMLKKKKPWNVKIYQDFLSGLQKSSNI